MSSSFFNRVVYAGASYVTSASLTGIKLLATCAGVVTNWIGAAASSNHVLLSPIARVIQRRAPLALATVFPVTYVLAASCFYTGIYIAINHVTGSRSFASMTLLILVPSELTLSYYIISNIS